jgi:hypothetical protein
VPRPQPFTCFLRQIAEFNPNIAARRTSKILAPDTMEFFWKFPFVADAVGVQCLSVIPVDFSGLRIDLQSGLLADREPLLIFSLLARLFFLTGMSGNSASMTVVDPGHPLRPARF